MKLDTPREVKVGGTTFYIRPFPAFTAANLSGELASLLLPMVSALAPLLAGRGEDKNLMDIDITEAAPVVSDAFGTLSGDKLEKMLRSLLVRFKNVHFDEEGEEEPTLLNEDYVNALFSGEIQNMFILAFEVIRTNFSGFFKQFGGLFGKAAERVGDKMTTLASGN